MAERRTRVAVTVDGIPRSLFTILEKPSGELIVPLTCASRRGNVGTEWEAATPVLEQRISIHPSPKSDVFTTIKRTTNLADGRNITSAALTDAVKCKTGFSLIFIRRVEDLSGDGYALLGRMGAGDRLLTVPEFERKNSTLFCGLCIGHPSVEFDIGHRDPMVHVAEIAFKEFQLVAIFSLEPMASHYTSEFAFNVTHDPSKASDSETRIRYWLLMSGLSPRDCMRGYRNGVAALSRRFLEMALAEATNAQTIEWINKRLREIPELASHFGPNAGQPTYLVSDGLPPTRR